MQAVKITLYNQSKQIVAYWSLMQAGDKFRLAYTYAGQPKLVIKYDTPDEAVTNLYNTYIDYFNKIHLKLESDLAELPKVEYVRAGFRPGWLKHERKKLTAAFTQFPGVVRKELTKLVQELKQKEWPDIALPNLPWELFNANQILYLTRTAAAYRGCLESTTDQRCPTDSQTNLDSSIESAITSTLARLKP